MEKDLVEHTSDGRNHATSFPGISRSAVGTRGQRAPHPEQQARHVRGEALPGGAQPRVGSAGPRPPSRPPHHAAAAPPLRLPRGSAPRSPPRLPAAAAALRELRGLCPAPPMWREAMMGRRRRRYLLERAEQAGGCGAGGEQSRSRDWLYESYYCMSQQHPLIVFLLLIVMGACLALLAVFFASGLVRDATGAGDGTERGAAAGRSWRRRRGPPGQSWAPDARGRGWRRREREGAAGAPSLIRLIRLLCFLPAGRVAS